ncbi:aminopeptidase N [Demequina sp. NBRC 110051]|uniref:aminopeptidase N n=1 Tax=Demequina sp. NBRC 110051 TaxID=1570340 RepID=UPI000A035259|nr:aminopeptidase N [Demequina sp. NBRC 110051]
MATTLTRDEATARAAVLSSAEYRVHLDFTGTGDTFRSTSTVIFDAARDSATFLDLVGKAVSVRVNGEELDPATVHVDDRVYVSGMHGPTEVVIEAECDYRTTGQGIHRFIDAATGDWYLYSQFATDDARGAFAVFDQPDIKGTFQFTVTAPAAWQVISNTAQPAPVESGEGALTWEFAPTVPLPCYAAAVVAGPYVYEEAVLQSAKGDIPARVYGRPEVADHLASARLFADVQAGISLYERIFATEYPYDSYDQIYVPQYNWGAMENAGCVTISEDRYLFRTEVSQSELEARTNVVLHELAHMWFGNLVTMRWWDDLWLNESFADFVAHHAATQVTEYTDAWVAFGAGRKSVGYVQDQLPTTHPVLGDVPTVEAVTGTFDMITYAKGASALRQLAATLDLPVFFAGVASYVHAHHHGNATLADLFAELESASGRDLSAWSRAWLETPGVTTLSAQVTTDDAGAVTSLIVDEEVPEGALHHPHRLVIGGYTLSDEGLTRRWKVSADVAVGDDGAGVSIAEAIGKAAPDLLLVNDGDLTYAKVRLDARSLATVEAHIAELSDPMAQHLVLDSLWHSCRDGVLPAARYVGVVLEAAGTLTNSEVLGAHLAQIATAIRRYAPPASREELAGSTAQRLWQLLGEAAPGSDAQLQLLRGFASLVTTDAQAQIAAELLDGVTSIEGREIDSELTWDLVTALAQAGRMDDAGIDERLAADPSTAGQRRAAGARAALAGAEAKRRAWDSIAHPDGAVPPNAIAFATALGLGRSHRPEDLEPLLDEILAGLRPMYESMASFMALRVANYVFPTALAGRVPGLTGRVEAWLADNADAPSTLLKAVTEGLDEIRRSERAQQAR